MQQSKQVPEDDIGDDVGSNVKQNISDTVERNLDIADNCWEGGKNEKDWAFKELKLNISYQFAMFAQKYHLPVLFSRLEKDLDDLGSPIGNTESYVHLPIGVRYKAKAYAKRDGLSLDQYVSKAILEQINSERKPQTKGDKDKEKRVGLLPGFMGDEKEEKDSHYGTHGI